MKGKQAHYFVWLGMARLKFWGDGQARDWMRSSSLVEFGPSCTLIGRDSSLIVDSDEIGKNGSKL